MPETYTREQIEKLKSLGIDVSGLVPQDSVNQPTVIPTPPPVSAPEISPVVPKPEPEIQPTPEPLIETAIEPQPVAPETLQSEIDNTLQVIPPSPISLLAPTPVVTKKTHTVVPLLSISGLTILSFGGILLLKGKNPQDHTTLKNDQSLSTQNSQRVTPTQVPKSIQHYLLTSQQFFSQALQIQNTNSNADSSQTVNLLNQSILAASDAIKEFPNDSRGYYQRGKIYQSLVDSKPELLNQAISDLAMAQKLNPESAEITHDLAAAFAKKGDAQNTIAFLTKTVSLDPTKAQNFYDLAKIQQQAGLLPQALDTYNRLLTLVTDPTQKAQVESEKSALEKLVAQNPNFSTPTPAAGNSIDNQITFPDNPPTLQAMGEDTSGLIIAAPETEKKIEVSTQTDSNSLSGNATLSANQKEITIQNSKLTPTSQVYVSIISGGKNQTLQVLSKSTDSFVVGFDTPISEEVQFKWWIIN